MLLTTIQLLAKPVSGGQWGRLLGIPFLSPLFPMSSHFNIREVFNSTASISPCCPCLFHDYRSNCTASPMFICFIYVPIYGVYVSRRPPQPLHGRRSFPETRDQNRACGLPCLVASVSERDLPPNCCWRPPGNRSS